MSAHKTSKRMSDEFADEVTYPLRYAQDAICCDRNVGQEGSNEKCTERDPIQWTIHLLTLSNT